MTSNSGALCNLHYHQPETCFNLILAILGLNRPRPRSPGHPLTSVAPKSDIPCCCRAWVRRAVAPLDSRQLLVSTKIAWQGQILGSLTGHHCFKGNQSWMKRSRKAARLMKNDSFSRVTSVAFTRRRSSFRH